MPEFIDEDIRECTSNNSDYPSIDELLGYEHPVKEHVVSTEDERFFCSGKDYLLKFLNSKEEEGCDSITGIHRDRGKWEEELEEDRDPKRRHISID